MTGRLRFKEVARSPIDSRGTGTIELQSRVHRDLYKRVHYCLHHPERTFRQYFLRSQVMETAWDYNRDALLKRIKR